MRQLIAQVEAWRHAAPPQAPRKIDSLTTRQVEILGMIAQGHANREIAERLSITEGTVKVHISALLKRLGVSSRLQAARLVPTPNGI
jgi:two-component system nitrate/nitrite response regulator NarL